MPLLALAFTVGRLISGHRLMLAGIFCLRTIVHVLSAFVVSVGCYGLALLAMVNTYTHALPLVDAVYGVGFALATFLAVCGGTMVAPRWLLGIFMPAAGASAAMFPFGLYLQNGLQGDWRAVFLWYLSASLAGSVAAIQLMSHAAGQGSVGQAHRMRPWSRRKGRYLAT